MPAAGPPGKCSNVSASPTSRRHGPASSRAGSASASGWLVRLPAARRPSPGRAPLGTRRSHARGASGPSSGAFSTTSTFRFFSSPTISRTPRSSPTASAVLVDGQILQVGTPAELIAAPSDAFVASFTGANLLAGRAARGAGGLTEVTLDDGSILYSVDEVEGPVGVAVYPWEVSIAREQAHGLGAQPRRGPIVSVVEIGNPRPSPGRLHSSPRSPPHRSSDSASRRASS